VIPFATSLLEGEDGEPVQVIHRRGSDVYVEAEFVDTLASLREINVNVYDKLWDLVITLKDEVSFGEGIES